MSQFTFESQPNGTFLVYRLEANEMLDHTAMGMLANNNIPGLLTLNSLFVDGQTVVRARTTSLTALMGYWGKSVNKKKVLSFLDSFCSCFRECREYLLDPANILLDPDYVFVDGVSGQVRLAYIPVVGKELQGQSAEAFLHRLFQGVQFAEDEDGSYISVVMNGLHAQPFSIEFLYAQIQKLREGDGAPQRRAIVQAEPLPEKAPRQAPVLQPEPKPVPEPAKAQPEPEKKQEGMPFAPPQPVKPEKAAKKEKAAKPHKPEKKPKQAAPGFGFAIPGMDALQPDQPQPQETVQQDVAQPQTREKAKGGLFGDLFGKKKHPAQKLPPVPSAPAQPGLAVPPAKQEDQPAAVPPAAPRQPGMVTGRTVNLPGADVGRTIGFQPEEQPESSGVKTYHIIRLATGEKVEINADLFHVGRDPGRVQYCPANCKAWLGSDHGYFIREDDQLYVVDNNSMNHTWLNGQQLVSNQKYLLSDNDVVKMADEEFKVQIRNG